MFHSVHWVVLRRYAVSLKRWNVTHLRVGEPAWSSYDLLIWKVLSFTCLSVKKKPYANAAISDFWTLLRFLIDFRFADFRMIQISALPVFRISWFSRSWFTCQPAAWIEGLFDDVALKSQFSDPKWNLLSRFSESRAIVNPWTVVLSSYWAWNGKVSLVLSFGLLAWDSNVAIYKQFLKDGIPHEELEYGSICESVPLMN